MDILQLTHICFTNQAQYKGLSCGYTTIWRWVEWGNHQSILRLCETWKKCGVLHRLTAIMSNPWWLPFWYRNIWISKITGVYCDSGREDPNYSTWNWLFPAPLFLPWFFWNKKDFCLSFCFYVSVLWTAFSWSRFWKSETPGSSLDSQSFKILIDSIFWFIYDFSSVFIKAVNL